MAKKFTDDRARAFAEASAYAQGYGPKRRGHRNARAPGRFQRVVSSLFSRAGRLLVLFLSARARRTYVRSFKRLLAHVLLLPDFGGKRFVIYVFAWMIRDGSNGLR